MIALRNLVIAFALSLWLSVPAFAAAGTIFVDTGGATTNSGTTDTNSAVISGTAATWTSGTAVITLDTNTNFATVPGCSAGTCDGSQAIFLTNATNAQQKIFWLSSYTGCTGSGACSLTVSQNATCTVCTAQNWAIGGRLIWTAANVESALRAGDTVTVNNDVASIAAGANLTIRVGGDATSGPITWQGKAGVRPKFTNTGTGSVVGVSAGNNIRIQNLEFVKNNATGSAVVLGATLNAVLENVRVTVTAGVSGITSTATGSIALRNSEVVGGSGDAVAMASNVGNIFGNNIHGATGNCLTISATTPQEQIVSNILTGCGGRGLYFSGASANQNNGAIVDRNTIYNNLGSGMEVANANTSIYLTNNIFMNNGDASSEFNVLWAAGNAQLAGFHDYNLFFHSNCQGSNTGGPACVSSLTLNTNEKSSDPLFSNAAGGDFSLAAGSPAKSAGFPGAFLGGSSTGLADMGAVQSQGSSSGGAHVVGGGL